MDLIGGLCQDCLGLIYEFMSMDELNHIAICAMSVTVEHSIAVHIIHRVNKDEMVNIMHGAVLRDQIFLVKVGMIWWRSDDWIIPLPHLLVNAAFSGNARMVRALMQWTDPRGKDGIDISTILALRYVRRPEIRMELFHPRSRNIHRRNIE